MRPTPTSHGKSTDAPVSASVDPVDPVDPNDDVDPAPVLPETPAEETGNAVLVVVAPAAVVDVVEDEVVLVLVLVEVDVEVDVVAAAAAVKVTLTGMVVRSTLSEVSSAVYVTASAVVSLTVNVATPLLLLVALVLTTFDEPPDSDTRRSFR